MEDVLLQMIKDVQETQKKHFELSSSTHDQAIKTNGRVTSLEATVGKHDKRINTMWDWRLLVIGGGAIITGLLAYLIPMTLAFPDRLKAEINEVVVDEEEVREIISDVLEEQAIIIKN